MQTAPAPLQPRRPPPRDALIEARGLTLRLGRRTVLENVDFALHAGEIVTVVGPNGSGKTSLMRALIGAIRPAAGAIRRARNLRLGYVPQRLAVDGPLPLTVSRFLDLPVRRDPREAAAALARTGAAGLETRPMAGLSGGQFQRVLLARALLGAPHLLLLDEPTQGLDQPGAAAFYKLIEELRADLGCAVMLISHDLHVVMSASDRVVCLNGHVCCEGAPAHVASAPEYRALFGMGTQGAFALYRHEHDHDHDHGHDHAHGHGHDHAHGHGHDDHHRHDHRHGEGPDRTRRGDAPAPRENP